MGNPRFEFIRHDITFSLYVEADEIYNLACPASLIHYQNDPVQTTKTSFHGAINMADLFNLVFLSLYSLGGVASIVSTPVSFIAIAVINYLLCIYAQFSCKKICGVSRISKWSLEAPELMMGKKIK